MNFNGMTLFSFKNYSIIPLGWETFLWHEQFPSGNQNKIRKKKHFVVAKIGLVLKCLVRLGYVRLGKFG